jgi:Na+/melibiose symporter-like transporter
LCCVLVLFVFVLCCVLVLFVFVLCCVLVLFVFILCCVLRTKTNQTRTQHRTKTNKTRTQHRTKTNETRTQHRKLKRLLYFHLEPLRFLVPILNHWAIIQSLCYNFIKRFVSIDNSSWISISKWNLNL